MMQRRATGQTASHGDTDVPVRERPRAAPALGGLVEDEGGEDGAASSPAQHEVHAGHFLGAESSSAPAEGATVQPPPRAGFGRGGLGRASIFGGPPKKTCTVVPPQPPQPGETPPQPRQGAKAAHLHRGSLGRQSVFHPLKRAGTIKLPGAAGGGGTRRQSIEQDERVSKAEMTKQMESTIFQEHGDQRAFILDPDSKVALYWYVALLLALCYNALVIPYRIAFSNPLLNNPLLFDGRYAVDLASDAVLIIEIFLTFRRGYYEQGNKVLDPREIRKRYVSNLTDIGHPSFLRDVLSILPLDLFQLRFGMHGAFRLPRLLRTPRIFSCLGELGARYLGNHTTRIACLLALFLLLAHYVACFWFLFGVLEGFGANRWVPQPADEAANATGSVQAHQYISSVYHSLGMMVGVQDYGPPERVAEGIFHIVVMVASLLVFAYAIGVVSNIEESTNERALQFQARMQYVQLVLRHHKLSKPLVQRVTAYLQYQFEHHDDFDLSIVEELPEGLHTDVMRHVTSSLVQGVPLFRHVTEEGFFSTLTTQLAPVVFMRHETLILEQSHNDEMFFFVRGEAMELRGLPKPHLHRRLGPGDYCGENMLLSQCSASSVVTHTPCECFVLKAHKLREVLAYFPAADESLAEQVQAAQHAAAAALPRPSALSSALSSRRFSVLSSSSPSPPPSPPDADASPAAAAPRRSSQQQWQDAFAKQRRNSVQDQRGRLKALVSAKMRRSSSSSDVSQEEAPGPPKPAAIQKKLSADIQSAIESAERRRSSATAADMAAIIESVSAYEKGEKSERRGFWSFLITRIDAPRMPGHTNKAHGLLGAAEPLRLRYPLINPRSRFRGGWIVTSITCVLYTDLTLLYRLGFMPNPHAAELGYLLFDYATDVFFVLDLLLPLRTAYWRHVTLVTDAGDIARRYLRTSFALHLLSVLPLLLCLGWPGYHSDASQPWLRTPLLLRTFEVPYLIDEFARLRANSNFSARKLLKLLFIFVILAHSCAAGFGVVTQYDDAPAGADAELHRRESTGLHAYVRALWWAVTALTAFGTIATPSTVAMKAYSIVVLGFSLFTSVYMIGNIGVLIGNLDAAAVTFRKKRAATYVFARSQALPPEMSTRLHLYQQAVWTRGAGQNLQAVVQQLNPTIRADIMQHICHSIFISVPLFRDCGPKFISSLMETVHLECFPQNEWVCRRGSIATAMYIVMKGSVNVVIDEVKMVVVKRLSRGDFFGERSLFGAEKRNASIQAKTTVELVLLRADRFRAVLNSFPDVKRLIEEAKKRREAETEAAKDLVQTFQTKSGASERNSQHLFNRGRSKTAVIGALGSGTGKAGAPCGAEPAPLVRASTTTVRRRSSIPCGADAQECVNAAAAASALHDRQLGRAVSATCVGGASLRHRFSPAGSLAPAERSSASECANAEGGASGRESSSRRRRSSEDRSSGREERAYFLTVGDGGGGDDGGGGTQEDGVSPRRRSKQRCSELEPPREEGSSSDDDDGPPLAARSFPATAPERSASAVAVSIAAGAQSALLTAGATLGLHTPAGVAPHAPRSADAGAGDGTPADAPVTEADAADEAQDLARRAEENITAADAREASAREPSAPPPARTSTCMPRGACLSES